jgi:PAS domain-containing protein
MKFSDDLMAILQGISDGVVSLDRDAKYLSINKAGAEIIRQLGRNPDDLIGVSVWDAFPEVRGTIVEREIKRSLANGVRIEYEFLYPPNQHLYHVQGYPSTEGVILVFRDLTSRANQ